MKYTEKAMEVLKRLLEVFESGNVPKLLSRLIIPP